MNPSTPQKARGSKERGSKETHDTTHMATTPSSEGNKPEGKDREMLASTQETDERRARINLQRHKTSMKIPLQKGSIKATERHMRYKDFMKSTMRAERMSNDKLAIP